MTRALFTLLIALVAWPSLAEILQYKSTLRAETPVTPRWANDGDNLSPDSINALVADAKGIELRFELGRYVGKNVRIHMVLPPSVQGLRGSTGFRAEWRTRGRFNPGSIVPGSRALVYQGTVNSRDMTEIFDFTLHMDGRYLMGKLGFDPVFEIESIAQ